MPEWMAQTELVEHARLSPLQVDAAGVAVGFVIDNPRGPDLKVSLGQLRVDGASEAQNNLVRKVVYDAYALGASHVPAFTPLLACVAESATLIVHSDANWEGMRFRFVPVPETQSPEPGQHFYANVQGNPLLPDRISNFSFGGVEHQVVVEQQNKYYLGKDGRWYTTNPLELLTHELAHGCGKLQAWSAQGELAYLNNIRSGQVPSDEVRAIDFVNQTVLEPMGLAGRNPQSYFEAKPDDAIAGHKAPLDAAGLENLRHGAIPVELHGYPQPTLHGVEGRHEQRTEIRSPDVPAGLAQALETAGLCEASQSGVIARRMAEQLSMQLQAGSEEPFGVPVQLP